MGEIPDLSILVMASPDCRFLNASQDKLWLYEVQVPYYETDILLELWHRHVPSSERTENESNGTLRRSVLWDALIELTKSWW